MNRSNSQRKGFHEQLFDFGSYNFQVVYKTGDQSGQTGQEIEKEKLTVGWMCAVIESKKNMFRTSPMVAGDRARFSCNFCVACC